MGPSKPWEDFEDSEIRNWLSHDVGQAFLVGLREDRADLIKALISAAQISSPAAATAAGGVTAIEAILYQLREVP